MNLCKRILMLSLAAGLPAATHAQTQQPQEATPPEDSIVRLISADKAWQVTEEGSHYRRVVGNARFLHNDTYLLCDSASWNVDAEVIEAFGNVQLMQEGTRLTSDCLTYLIPQNLAQFHGELVELTDKERNRLRTRQLEYNTKDSVAFFTDGGAMRSKEGNIVEGLRGTYDSRLKRFTFEEEVKVFLDSMLMRTQTLTYYTEEEKVLFGKETHTWQDETFIRADGGWYTRKDSTVCYRDNVYAMDDTYELWCGEGYRYGLTREIELKNRVRVLEPKRNTALYGDLLRYQPDSSKAYLLETPAAAFFGENENHTVDTLFVSADTMIFRVVPKYEFSAEEIASAEKRREDALFDALAEFRAKQAAERQKKIEEALRASGKLPPLKPDSTVTPPPPRPMRSTTATETLPAGDSDPEEKDDASENETPPADTSATVAPPPAAAQTAAAAPSDSTEINCIWAFHNVKMFRSDLQAAADSLTFSTLDSIAMLLGRPVMWNQVKNQLTSETMHLFIKDGNVHRGSMLTDARITTREDEEHFNQIKSAEMMGFFRNNELYRYDALGSVAAIFYMEEEGVLTNVNIKESKSLTAMIKDAVATRLLYLEDIKSDAYPIPDLESEKQKFKGFEWRGDERPQTRYHVTQMPVPTSWRPLFAGMRPPVFNETDDYFDGYMSGVYQQLAIRAEARNWNRIEKRLDRSTRALREGYDAELSAGIDALVAATDSLTLRLLDSLYVFRVPEAEKLDIFPDSHPAKVEEPAAPEEVKPAKKLSWRERRALRREARRARRAERRAQRAVAREARAAARAAAKAARAGEKTAGK